MNPDKEDRSLPAIAVCQPKRLEFVSRKQAKVFIHRSGVSHV